MFKQQDPKQVPFKQLPKHEQRVAIAKDVIKQLDANIIKAINGAYLLDSETDMRSWGFLSSGAMGPVKVSPGEPCQACALGSLFVCAVEREEGADYRGIPIKASTAQPLIHENLAPYFDKLQLGMIEAAFERSSRYVTEYDPDNQRLGYECVDFGDEYADPDTRMRAIMQNIIDNEGEFKP